MKKKLVVDKETCIGCGTCVALAPKVFELQDDGKAEVKLLTPRPLRVAKQGGRANSKLLTKIKEAMESCPVEAIKEI